MGLKINLNSLIPKNCDKTKNVEYEVNIINEIKNYQKTNKNNEPILIVIDSLNLSYTMMKNKRVCLLGGQHNELIKIIDNFFQTLISLGVTLKFFIDGCVPKGKSVEKMIRIKQRYDLGIILIDAIKNNNGSVKELCELKGQQYLCYTAFTFALIVRKYGEILVTYDQIDCDALIADYAMKNNAFAILSSDSDFLIYCDKSRLWATKSLNYNNFHTTETNRITLREKLQLTVNQMPLLATLVGNDLLQSSKHLYKYKQHINALRQKNPDGNFILDDCKSFPKHRNDWTDKHYSQLSMKLFEKTSIEMITILKESVSQYELPLPDLNTPNGSDTDLRLIQNEFISYNYRIIKRIPIDVSYSYTDLRVKPYKYVPQLHVLLIQKQMGILLHDRSDKESNSITINVKDSHKKPYGARIIYSIYPNSDILKPVDNLMELYDEKRTDFDKIKYQLLSWMVSDNLIPPNMFKCVSMDCFIPVLTLIYLKCNRIITENEAYLFLLISINDIAPNFLPRPSRWSSNIDFPQQISSHAFQLTFIYCDMYNSVMRSLSAIGLRKYFQPQTFNGILFHQLYSKINDKPNLFKSQVERSNVLKGVSSIFEILK